MGRPISVHDVMCRGRGRGMKVVIKCGVRSILFHDESLTSLRSCKKNVAINCQWEESPWVSDTYATPALGGADGKCLPTEG